MSLAATLRTRAAHSAKQGGAGLQCRSSLRDLRCVCVLPTARVAIHASYLRPPSENTSGSCTLSIVSRPVSRSCQDRVSGSLGWLQDRFHAHKLIACSRQLPSNNTPSARCTTPAVITAWQPGIHGRRLRWLPQRLRRALLPPLLSVMVCNPGPCIKPVPATTPPHGDRAAGRANHMFVWSATAECADVLTCRCKLRRSSPAAATHSWACLRGPCQMAPGRSRPPRRRASSSARCRPPSAQLCRCVAPDKLSIMIA